MTAFQDRGADETVSDAELIPLFCRALDEVGKRRGGRVALLLRDFARELLKRHLLVSTFSIA